MVDLDTVIHFWKTHLDQRENQLTDHQYKVIQSTINHLAEYKKLKEQVHAKLPLSPDSPTG